MGNGDEGLLLSTLVIDVTIEGVFAVCSGYANSSLRGTDACDVRQFECLCYVRVTAPSKRRAYLSTVC